MEDIFGKIIALILAVLLLFVAPILLMFENQDETSRIYVLSETSKFVDSVRSLGYISPTFYEDYQKKLSNTNNLYEIKMEHYHLSHDPVYTDFSDASTFQNDFKVNYKAAYNQEILEKIYPTSNTRDLYKMSKGDYFCVLVYNKNKTFATKIQEMLYSTPLSASKIVVNYGGVVKDEIN
ncbi:MAG TPA: hypothetical protein VHT34_05760 [Clostridia bacterium]|nr:hypothetical protein [Clostridia bacterium]